MTDLTHEQQWDKIVEVLGSYAESLGFFRGRRFAKHFKRAMGNSDFWDFANLVHSKIDAHEGKPYLSDFVAQIGFGRFLHHLIDIYHHPMVAGDSAENKAALAYTYLFFALPMYGNPPLYTEFKKLCSRLRKDG